MANWDDDWHEHMLDCGHRISEHRVGCRLVGTPTDRPDTIEVRMVVTLPDDPTPCELEAARELEADWAGDA